jgi:hypothetical protein
MAQNVDLAQLAKLARENLAETKALRHELTILKSELRARLAHFDVRIEDRPHERVAVADETD